MSTKYTYDLQRASEFVAEMGHNVRNVRFWRDHDRDKGTCHWAGHCALGGLELKVARPVRSTNAQAATLDRPASQEPEGLVMSKFGSVFSPRNVNAVHILLAALAGCVICCSPLAVAADMVVATLD